MPKHNIFHTYNFTIPIGKVKWELPKEERRFREVGKLSVPDFSVKEKAPTLQNVGKLKWEGVSNVL